MSRKIVEINGVHVTMDQVLVDNLVKHIGNIRYNEDNNKPLIRHLKNVNKGFELKNTKRKLKYFQHNIKNTIRTYTNLVEKY